MKVWVQLAEMFGKSFYREMGDEPPVLWVQAISRLRHDQLGRGLKNLAEDNLSFPPNLSQFVSACQRVPPRRYNGVKSLPEPGKKNADAQMTKAEKQKAEAARREIFKTLRLRGYDDA